MTDPFWLFMSIACVLVAVNGPIWWLNLIVLWAAWQYLKMAVNK